MKREDPRIIARRFIDLVITIQTLQATDPCDEIFVPLWLASDARQQFIECDQDFQKVLITLIKGAF